MRNGRENGFALVVVIWAIGILALLFMTYIAAARYRSIEASSLSRHARAEAMANIGVNLAILDLLSGISRGATRSARFGSDGTPVFCTLEDGWRLAISVVDEGGKIDLNTANTELIEALIRGMNADGKVAALVAKNIQKLREAPAEARSAQGASSSAPALRSVFELHQVAGVNRDLFRALVPLVTVHSGSTGVDPGVAPLELLRAVSPGNSSSSREAARRGLPAFYVAESAGKVFLIESEAMATSGARFSRGAIVEFEPPVGYRIREWRDGSLRIIDSAAAGGPLC